MPRYTDITFKMEKEISKEFKRVWDAIKELKNGKASKNVLKENGKSRVSITKLILDLKTEDFFKSPKTSEEIRKELAANGHHYAAPSLTWSLQELVRKRELGRIPEGKGWKYAKR